MILHETLYKRNSAIVTRKFYDRVYGASRRAKQFVFDERASALIGQFIDECGDLILKHRQFAKPPYETTYIEYNAHAMYQGHYGELPPLDQDAVVGYLIDGHYAYVVSAKLQGQTHPALWPVFYYIGDRGTLNVPRCPYPTMIYGYDEEAATTNKIIALLGHYMPLRNTKAKDRRQFLAEQFTDVFFSCEAYWGGSAKLNGERSEAVLKECVGDVRTIWAGLLWLQSVPKTVSYSGQIGGARLYKGKRIPASEHHVVSIHLKPKAVIRKVYLRGAAKRDSPRYHDVRGFWRHKDGLRTGCSHEWPDEANEKHMFVCTNCQRRRWWVKPHHRGDKSKGTITKDYAIDIEAKK